MEAAIKPKPICQKRKQHPSNPLAGVLTRNKSRRYLRHCTRSGKIRSDPVGNDPPVISSDKPRIDTSVLIKDLRAHRVFSKPLVVKDVGPSFDCKLREIRNPNLSVLVKCGSDVEGLVEKNPNYDCKSGEMENPNLSTIRNPSFNCVLGETKSPNLSSVRNPDFVEKFSLDVVCNDESLNVQNRNLLERSDSVAGLKGKEKSDSVFGLKGEGLDGRHPSLLENFELEVGCEKEGLDEQNLELLEKCDSIVDSQECRFDEQNHTLLENFNKEVDCKVEGFNEQSPTLLGKCDSLEAGKDGKFGVGLACNGSVLDDMSPNLSNKDLNVRKCEDLEDLMEINLQTTPPDAVVSLSHSEVCNVVVKSNVVSSLPHNRVHLNKDGSTEGQNANSILKKTSVLKPCSRPRVYKPLNSFSYRRLLPYLMDLAKDTSSPLKLDDHPKSENSDIVKPVVSESRDGLSDSHESDEKQVTTDPVCEILEVSTVTDSKQEKESSLDPHFNAITLHVSSQIPMDQSHNDGHENQNVTRVSDGSPEGGASHDEQISSGNHEKLEEIATEEDPCRLSLYSAEECKALLIECKTKEKSISVFHKSNVEGFVSSSGPIVGPIKGILKKNPRGCRGICDCLNCALFRLNAEKAFEFSRSQLLDAEELVLDMMKEMANLRSLLEKSANGVESVASIPVNQVQEACYRASDVETIARNRLSQMNEDLYVHCRNKPMQRPRVNFF